MLISGCEFLVDALLFEMGHLDFLLGMEWLKTSGEVVHNWKQQSMRFMFNGKSVAIQGLSNSQVPKHHYIRGYRWKNLD